MNLYEVVYKMNSWGDSTTCQVVATSAAKAIEGAHVAAWKSNHRKPHEVLTVTKRFEINYVQR